VNVPEDVLDRATRELPGLDEMLEELERAPEVFQPSRFWDHHNVENLTQIAADGFGAFKRTVNTNYFQWEPGTPRGDGPRERVARRLLSLWSRHPDPRVFGARLAEPTRSLHHGKAARWHAICVAMLWDHAMRRDSHELLRGCSEPDVGEALQVRHRGRLVSEDLANSALELTAIADAGGLPAPGGLVVELGAGYGRLGWLMLEKVPGLRYVVCDIPPALAIAQRYLTELYPQLPTFRFRPFDDPHEAAGELAQSQIGFLLPHQLAALPPLGADLFVNISSLHEMRREQIAAWFSEIDRHTAGRFYTKQWIESVNVFDDLLIRREEYPVPAHWQLILDREVESTPGFFEAVYRTHGAFRDRG
jgi:putative sugar O-methyltransferase